MEYADTVRRLLPRTVLLCDDPEMAKDFGATHLSMSGIRGEDRWYDTFLPDNAEDPYPNWSQGSIGLLRAFPPPELAPWMPRDVTASARAAVAAQAETARRLGLKAMLSGLEPLWLPEAAYRAHPRWRGSQCELGRIAGKPYFVPDIDEPEVLDLYRRAMRDLCRAHPEFEIFSFFTNDSGTGIPWATYGYPGPNGPMHSRHRDPGARVVGWLEAMRSGAEEAGVRIRINVHSFSFPPGETAAVRARLGSSFYLNHVNGDGEPLVGGSATFRDIADPVVGLSDPEGFLRGLERVFRPADGSVRSINGRGGDPALARRLLEAFLDTPGAGSVRRAQALLRAAERTVGPEHAETLVTVWGMVADAAHTAGQVRQRGFSQVRICLTTARWLTRPLVPDPLNLTDAETARYRPYLFSTGTPEQNADLCYILGKPVFLGSGAVWMARWCLQEAIDRLRGARTLLAPSIAALSGPAREETELYDARIGAYACCLETAKNVIGYQHALNTADQPRFGANPLDFDDNIQYDQRALEFRKIARAELDNTVGLIELAERRGAASLIRCARTPEGETVFRFGPNLVDDLRRKTEVMLDHWHEYERRFPTSKVREFEPDLRAPDDTG